MTKLGAVAPMRNPNAEMSVSYMQAEATVDEVRTSRYRVYLSIIWCFLLYTLT